MKRSEMVEILSRALICPHVILREGIEDCFVTKAERVLDLIEKHGMLPPYSGSDPISDEALGDFGENACTSDHVCGCNWDLE